MNTLTRPCIATHSINALGIPFAALGQGSPSNAAWPAASDAIFIPFHIDRPMLARRMYMANGNVAGNTVDMGIFTKNGARIVSSGSAAQTGASALQFFDITDTWLSPDQYYMAAVINGTTGTTHRFNPSIILCQQLGVLKATSAYLLPASVTLATVTAAYVPIIGIEAANTLL